VHVSNQDYGEKGCATADEKREKNRIYREALEARLPAGSVCIYLLTPTAQPVDVAPLNQDLATNPARLAEKMERLIQELKIAKGKPLLEPSEEPSAPECEPDAVVLHFTARYLERRGDALVRPDNTAVLGTRKGGNWGDLPSEGWVVLDRPDWIKLLPVGEVRAGTAWDLDLKVTAKLLTHFYPPTENTDNDKNRIDEQSLRARVESVDAGVARARIEGKLKMKHPFYHKDDKNFVEATLVGYLEFEIAKPNIRTLRLVTDKATYGEGSRPQNFGVAVRSVQRGK
jgi:hypothetical protein